MKRNRRGQRHPAGKRGTNMRLPLEDMQLVAAIGGLCQLTLTEVVRQAVRMAAPEILKRSKEESRFIREVIRAAGDRRKARASKGVGR